ncbi:hypothetical protein O181_091846 [Austropuccinia psidii MF-1]|uniref:Uncharacterized protein n=1 Tax=Austropuccinia psidii MF-1 TaxID=1389203 RepID=A0A9Q3IY81_9BASI|nr:hypothetical protein [Austropuccinia psidii MF-1]
MAEFPMNAIALRKLKKAKVGIELNKSNNGKPKEKKNKPNSKSLITGESNDSKILQPHADPHADDLKKMIEWMEMNLKMMMLTCVQLLNPIALLNRPTLLYTHDAVY